MLSEAEFYNTKFGVKEFISFQPGINGLTRATLYCASNHSYLEVYLHGAHITSWTRNQAEHLFMSRKAVFEKGKALRGGIPIIFPQFGPGKIPSHGFARTSAWDVVETKVEKGEPCIVFQLKDSRATRDIWDFPFEAKFIIQLGSKLQLDLRVKNTGSSSFDFQAAFHTYFLVSDIRNAYIVGLKDVNLVDKVRNGEKDKETRHMVVISEEVDRIYVGAENAVYLVDKGKDRSLRLDRTNFPDVVVWNPGAAKAKALTDLGEEAFAKFVCMEVGKITNPAHLEPSQEWAASHTIDADATTASL